MSQKVDDYIDRIKGVNQQTAQLENEIIMQQNNAIQKGAEALWDAYVHSNELAAQQQYQQDMSVIRHWEDTLRSPGRALNFTNLIVSGGLTYSSYVAFALNPTMGAGVGLVLTVSSFIVSVLSYYDIIIE